MTRTTTGLCLAAALGFAVSLGAQPPTPDQSATPDRSQSARDTKSDKGHDVTVTGCLAHGGDANYTLNNAHIDEPTSSRSSATTDPTAPPTPTTGSTAGTTGTTSSMGTMTWKLEGGKDLDSHVGHKIQVVGKTDWTGSSSPTATTGTTGTTSSANQPRLDVSSIKMVSSSCQ